MAEDQTESTYRALFEDFLVEPKTMGENGDYASFCPAHEDPETSKKPSALLNFGEVEGHRALWHCFGGCDSNGKNAFLPELARRFRAREGGNVIPLRPAKTSAAPGRPLPTLADNPDLVHVLMNNAEALAALKEARGYTDETIELWGIGWRTTALRYTLPIWSDDKTEIVNVRQYRLNADRDKLTWWAKGGAAEVIFGAWHDDHSRPIILNEGETDAILACQDGFNAMSTTGGALTFKPAWAKYFAGRIVYICYDADEAGRKGAAHAISLLRQVAAQVYNVQLPDGQDYTDFRILEGHSVEEFQALLTEAEKHPLVKVKAQASSGPLPDTGKPSLLLAIEDAGLSGVPLELDVRILGRIDPSPRPPKTVRFNCNQDKSKTACAACPMSLADGEMERTYRLDDEDHTLEQLIDVRLADKESVLAKSIKARCKDRITFTDVEMYTVEQLWVTDSITRQREMDFSGSSSEKSIFLFDSPAAAVPNIDAKIIGNSVPNPKDQRTMFVAWNMERSSSNIDRFTLTPELFEALKIFQIREGQQPLAKMEEIAEDLSLSVTKIYGRPQIHMAYDIVMHSLLDFKFDGQRLSKAWVEAMIAGDGRTGKTEVGTLLVVHYRCGAIYSCDRASLAGLIGGNAPISKGGPMGTKWGILPQNDRRFVMLDEAHSLKTRDDNLVARMSSIRSSGEAEINLISGGRTTARTRLIWIVNPSVDMQVQKGIEVVQELMEAKEDVARLDFALSVAKNEIDPEIVNASHEGKIPETHYPSELCESLIMWAWSRKSEQVVWAKGTEAYLLRQAIEVGHKYEKGPAPLVQTENIRFKIARIAAAIAARTFSTRDGVSLLIRKIHVEAAVQWLNQCYTNPRFGYSRQAAIAQKTEESAEAQADLVKRILSGKDSAYPEAGRLSNLLNGSKISGRLFQDNPSNVDTAQRVLGLLIENGFLRPDANRQGFYVKSPVLVRILDELTDEMLLLEEPTAQPGKTVS